MTWEALHRGANLTLEESTLLGADYFGLVAATEDFRDGHRRISEDRPGPRLRESEPEDGGRVFEGATLSRLDRLRAIA